MTSLKECLNARRWLALSVLFCFSAPVAADQLRIAVASNFRSTLEQIVSRFEKPDHIAISSGSTGQLYAQIVQGAPFDLFFAADSSRPKQLEQAKLAKQRRTYAIGQLALWAPKIDAVGEHTLHNHQPPIAIANPAYAPYGRAAQQILTTYKITTPPVLGSNIAQAFGFVKTGNATAGLVSVAQLRLSNTPPEQYWQVPAHYHEPIVQQLVVINSTNADLPAFLNFLSSKQVTDIIQNTGYRLPEESLEELPE